MQIFLAYYFEFLYIIYGLRRKTLFCTHLQKYSVQELRTNLIFKQFLKYKYNII